MVLANGRSRVWLVRIKVWGVGVRAVVWEKRVVSEETSKNLTDSHNGWVCRFHVSLKGYTFLTE